MGLSIAGGKASFGGDKAQFQLWEWCIFQYGWGVWCCGRHCLQMTLQLYYLARGMHATIVPYNISYCFVRPQICRPRLPGNELGQHQTWSWYCTSEPESICEHLITICVVTQGASYTAICEEVRGWRYMWVLHMYQLWHSHEGCWFISTRPEARVGYKCDNILSARVKTELFLVACGYCTAASAIARYCTNWLCQCRWAAYRHFLYHNKLSNLLATYRK